MRSHFRRPLTSAPTPGSARVEASGANSREDLPGPVDDPTRAVKQALHQEQLLQDILARYQDRSRRGPTHRSRRSH